MAADGFDPGFGPDNCDELPIPLSKKNNGGVDNLPITSGQPPTNNTQRQFSFMVRTKH